MINNPWECPRCKTINSAWMNQCTCEPEMSYAEMQQTAFDKMNTFESDDSNRYKFLAICQLCNKIMDPNKIHSCTIKES